MTAAQLKTKIASLTNAARLHDTTLNEGGDGYNPYRQEIATLQAHLDKLASAAFDQKIADEKTAEEALWTLELTTQRRAEWNAWVRGNSTKGKLHPAKVAAQIQAQGWSLEPLKRAIARHGL